MYMIVVSVKINDDDHVLWASCTINTKVITAVDEPLYISTSSVWGNVQQNNYFTSHLTQRPV